MNKGGSWTKGCDAPSQSLAVKASRARDVMPLKLDRKSRFKTTVRPEDLVWCLGLIGRAVG